MNTLFWGRPAWKFLFSIANNFNQKEKKQYQDFFISLKNILPCKYCRNSYKQYIKDIPIKNYLSSRKEFIYWLYLIHNKVNDKLRKQGYYDRKDPKFSSVLKKIKYRESSNWIFLFCIAFNLKIKPTITQKKYYRNFFNSLAKIYPNSRFRIKYRSALKKYPMNLSSRDKFTEWFTKIYNQVNSLKRKPSFETICNKYEKYRAKCGSKGSTCRN